MSDGLDQPRLRLGPDPDEERREDVTEVEPLPSDSRLWDAPNVVITPHTAGDSSEKERRCIEILRENLLRYAQGETLLNIVDKRRGY